MKFYHKLLLQNVTARKKEKPSMIFIRNSTRKQKPFAHFKTLANYFALNPWSLGKNAKIVMLIKIK